MTAWNLFKMPATPDQILAAINTVNRKLDVLMSQQDAIDTALAPPAA